MGSVFKVAKVWYIKYELARGGRRAAGDEEAGVYRDEQARGGDTAGGV